MTKSISMADFYQNYQAGQALIDVRESFDYQSGHVPGAVNLPLSQLEQQLDQLSKDHDYYIICQSGMRSERACAFLASLAFKVTNVEGGTASWPGELE